MLKYYDEETIKIINLYEYLSNKGITNAMINLANLYREGKRVSRNYTKALELYNKAKDNGNSNSIVYLAHMYEHPLGINRNIQNAINDSTYLYNEGKNSNMNTI